MNGEHFSGEQIWKSPGSTDCLSSAKQKKNEWKPLRKTTPEQARRNTACTDTKLKFITSKNNQERNVLKSWSRSFLCSRKTVRCAAPLRLERIYRCAQSIAPQSAALNISPLNWTKCGTLKQQKARKHFRTWLPTSASSRGSESSSAAEPQARNWRIINWIRESLLFGLKMQTQRGLQSDDAHW